MSHILGPMLKPKDDRSPVRERPPISILNGGNRPASEQRRRVTEEALRLVRRVFLPQNQEAPQVVVFAAIDPGNGCSEVCASVAETLAAHAARPVCLIDGNLHTPRLPEIFEVTNHYGLTDSLLEQGPIASFTSKPLDDNLRLLSAGMLVPDSASLLGSCRLEERLSELRKEHPFILVDAPPLNRYSDALSFSQHADGMVLVLEADVTRREAAAHVVAGLRSAGIRILGAVLNKRIFPIPHGLYQRL